MKKLFYACAALLCLALAASSLVLSGTGALLLLRKADDVGAGGVVSAPAPISSLSHDEGIRSADKAAEVTPLANAQPATSRAGLVPTVKAPSAPVSAKPNVYVWDLERVLKSSQAGQAVSQYADAYQKVMDKNIALLKAAIADKKKRYDVKQANKLISQFTQQKNSVWNDARSIIRGLVRSTATTAMKDALLLEIGNATYIPEGSDKTEELISRIDKIKLNIPDPPKPIVIK